MAAIAVHIGRVGQGYEQPFSPTPEASSFNMDTAVRVLAQQAKLDGYAVEPDQVTDTANFAINIHSLAVSAKSFVGCHVKPSSCPISL
jgi:hypothetical protein